MCVKPINVVLLAALAALPAGAQQRSLPVSNVRYDVTFDSASAQSRNIAVAMTFSVPGPGDVLLSLPSWTPGAYEVSNYARFVTTFDAFQAKDTLDWEKADPDTWRVTALRSGDVRIAFDYKADSLDNAM